jgi:hypothetical protein
MDGYVVFPEFPEFPVPPDTHVAPDAPVPPHAPVAPETDPLHELSVRILAGEPPSRVEVEGELEVGFGRLMALEAELARARKRVAAGQEPESVLTELQHQIAVLREALVELRTVSSPPGPPRIGYGFVLPDGCVPGPISGSRRGPRTHRG